MMKRALVTGANRGLGLAIARELGQQGCEVLIGARDLTRGEAVAKTLQEEGFKASPIKIDLGDPESLEQASAKLAEIGQIDILINNAGIAGNLETEKSKLDMGKSAFAYSREDLEETLATNFLGTHAVILALLPNLSETGQILNITVPVSQKYWEPLAYITSKAALNAMTFAMGHEFVRQKSQRQIFGIMPGAVATELNGAKPGGMVQTAEEAAKNIVHFLFDGKNHNATLINFDGNEIESYEPSMMATTLKDVAKHGIKRSAKRIFGKQD
jgi:NAD(P)-dependent dehydrogenase (short-subunit alcohol dehydrogenase family)